MSFFVPTHRRKRWLAASSIGIAWLVIAGLLWAYPISIARRSGVSRNGYGVLEAWVRKTSYHRMNSGQHLGYETGEGFAVTLIITACATSVAVGFYLWLIHKWRLPGHCVNCDYDLRDNTSGICPECGSTIRKPATDLH
jgi:hypothetical protein